SAQILKDMVANFWDSLFPPKKRLRGRVNALDWWRDKALEFLQNYKSPEPLSREVYDRLTESLTDLDAALAEKLDDPPLLHELMGYAERLPVQAPEPAPAAEDGASAEDAAAEQSQALGEGEPGQQAAEPAARPAPAPQPAASGPPPSATGPAPEPSGDDAADAKKLVRFGLDQLGQAADFYLRQDPANPMSYTLRRLFAWLQVEAPPPAENGQTMIPAPDGAVKSAIENLIGNREFENAVQSSEERISQFLFWLDLSRLTAQALDALGGRHADAREAVERETAQYVKKLKGVENLAFADGTPFADKDTRLWLKSIAQQGGGPVGGGGSAAQQRIDEALSKARELVKDKKLSEAVDAMQQVLDTAGWGMGRFLAHVAMARLLMEAGKGPLAKPHADLVVEEVDRRSLEAWDPGAALSGLATAYDVYAVEEGEQAQADARKILDRIARISSAAALRISGET
ncbi:MAG: type VI secretion system protein TssA, partial [Desulfovibrionaceae bacterium]